MEYKCVCRFIYLRACTKMWHAIQRRHGEHVHRDIGYPLLAAEHSPCKARCSGTPCRTTSVHSRTMSPLDSAWKPGFSLATSMLNALETLWQLRYINSHLPLPLPLPLPWSTFQPSYCYTTNLGQLFTKCEMAIWYWPTNNDAVKQRRQWLA